ncbi:GNAT family N-acetyltransferase [Pseudarthrobacter sp. fls2-241-R2A-127]|uniref:GNAT family N-acetyltransferase n=1 Tax=Pseudarthrobacter sp. fls2-241-R2A-127 TaxID=3040303 RepID=UPI0025525131|nr:GNAT family N-acetyltransferase [Pseudarthrobacter sp. fls2-241-R2A-127]
MQMREATFADLPYIGAICDASGRARWTREMITPTSGRVVLVAIVQDEVVGAAKTHFHGEPEGRAPAGHYLGGVIIDPNFRRRGIGSALTRVRMEWIWARSSTAYYFANEHNTASIIMHETLGFQSIGRFAQIRGVTADNGRSELVLFQARQ